MECTSSSQCGAEAAGAASDLPDGSEYGLQYFGNRICPFAHRAWWVLLELGVHFNYVHVDFVEKPERGSMWVSNNKPSWYTSKVTPLSTIPTLYDEGLPIFALKGCFESDTLSDHLIRKYGGSLSPTLLDEPAIRRAIARMSAAGVVPAMYALLSNQTAEKDARFATALYSKLAECVDILFTDTATDGPYFLGSQLSLADIALVPFLDRFEATLPFYRGVELLPVGYGGGVLLPLQRLLEACRTRPAFLQASQSNQFYIDACELNL
jgi:glutathione S-transferase